MGSEPFPDAEKRKGEPKLTFLCGERILEVSHSNGNSGFPAVEESEGFRCLQYVALEGHDANAGAAAGMRPRADCLPTSS